VRQLSFVHTGLPSQELVDRLGMNLIPGELPPGLEIYARTPDFTPGTLPADLASSHHLAEDAWGLIRVLQGVVLYALEAPNSASVIISAGDCAVIEPQTLHYLQFVEPGRFFIEFHIPRDTLRAHPEAC
jgi:tellurite resistance-related uncharacterized protein